MPDEGAMHHQQYRRIRRWEHEAVMDTVQQRLDRMPQAMTVRKSTVEHVFGTLKHWMGWTHFLTRGMGNVATEMSLNVLAYNFKRVIRHSGYYPDDEGNAVDGCIGTFSDQKRSFRAFTRPIWPGYRRFGTSQYCLTFLESIASRICRATAAADELSHSLQRKRSVKDHLAYST